METTVLDNMPWESADGLTQDQRDALRYKVIRDLIGFSKWPTDVVSMARNGKDLDSLVDCKAEELSKIIREVTA